VQRLLAEGRLRETPDHSGAFPRLEPTQLETLEAHGRRRRTRSGEVLVVEGDHDPAFYVVLDGTVAVLDGYRTADEKVLRVHNAGRFLRELGLLGGQPSFVTAVVAVAGEVLAVPVDEIRHLVAEDVALGEEIMRAYLLRRSQAIGQGVGIRIIGSRFSADTTRLREFASRNRLPHRFLDLETDTDADQALHRMGFGSQDTPMVVWGRRVLRNPSNAKLAEQIGLRTPIEDTGPVCDLLVVGGGPAGLALADHIEADSRIQVLTHTEVRELEGRNGMLEAIVVEDTDTGRRCTLAARELMVFIGATPCTSWLADIVELDSGGYIRTGSALTELGAYAELGRGSLPWRPPPPGCSPPGTSAVARYSGWPRRWVRAPWPSAWSTST
jgi:CRP-like cAMP-binding protein